MIPPSDSRDTASRRRIDTVPGLARAVDVVATPDIPRCLLLLSVSCADVTGIGAEPVVAETFSQWRTDGQVGGSVMLGLVELAGQAEEIALDGRVDAATRDVAFRRARALGCVYLGSGMATGAPDVVLREALRECSYEAAHALAGAAGVISVLHQFATADD